MADPEMESPLLPPRLELEWVEALVSGWELESPLLPPHLGLEWVVALASGWELESAEEPESCLLVAAVRVPVQVAAAVWVPECGQVASASCAQGLEGDNHRVDFVRAR